MPNLRRGMMAAAGGGEEIVYGYEPATLKEFNGKFKEIKQEINEIYDSNSSDSEIKKANELQTFKEKDSVFAYHFYRLINRAQNIWLIYNTEPAAMNNGEQSRFITQIEVEGIP